MFHPISGMTEMMRPKSSEIMEMLKKKSEKKGDFRIVIEMPDMKESMMEMMMRMMSMMKQKEGNVMDKLLNRLNEPIYTKSSSDHVGGGAS